MVQHPIASDSDIRDLVEQFLLEDEFSLLVLFRSLVGAIVLPSDDLLALPT